MARSKGPLKVAAEWADTDAPEVKGELVGKPGRHHGAEYIQKSKEGNAEYRAKVLRDLGGRDRVRGRIRPPEHADSGRTWKSSSKVRFPSAAYRRGYGHIDWSN